ncbi:MAG: peptidylprolyl isomerase, partial [Candidatus Neomarinimicrobiota bacterium]
GTGYNYIALMPLILKSRDQHLKSIRNIETLKEFIAGIIVREYLLSEAKEMKLDQDKVFQEQYQQKVTKLKIDTWIENISTVQFSDDDYQSYYKNNQSEFVIPVRRDVYEIRLPNKDLAVKCLQRIQNGEKFESINSEFAKYQRNSTSNGYLGLLTSLEVGKFGDAIFSAPIDAIVGPFEYQDAYYLFISTDEQPPHYLSLQEAKPIIEKKYHQELSQTKMQHYFSQKTDEYHVKKNFKVLKSIDYQDFGGKRGIIANE